MTFFAFLSILQTMDNEELYIFQFLPIWSCRLLWNMRLLVKYTYFLSEEYIWTLEVGQTKLSKSGRKSNMQNFKLFWLLMVKFFIIKSLNGHETSMQLFFSEIENGTLPCLSYFPSSAIHYWICTGLSGASQGSRCPGKNAHEQMPVSYNLKEKAAFRVIYIKIKFIPFPTE